MSIVELIVRIYDICMLMYKDKILSNLLLVIPVTPYNLYVCTSLITYFYLPETVHQIIKHGLMLFVGSLVEDIITNKYIGNKLLTKGFQWFSIAWKIFTIGYILSDLKSFKSQHENLDTNIGIKNINLLIIDLAIATTYYAFVFGSIVSFVLGLAYKVIIINKDEILDVYENIIKSFVRIALEILARPENYAIRTVIGYLFGLQSQQTNSEQTPNRLTLEQINEIAPLRCAGLANTENFEQTSCSVCLDCFDHTALHRTLECTHKFHPECVDRWLLHSPICPMCRQNILTSRAAEVQQ
jgi:hypothetical protein